MDFTNDTDFYVICKLYDTKGISAYVLNEINTSNIWSLEDKESKVNCDVKDRANDKDAFFEIRVKCYTNKKAKVSYESIDYLKPVGIIYRTLVLKMYLCDRTKTPNLLFDPLDNYYKSTEIKLYTSPFYPHNIQRDLV